MKRSFRGEVSGEPPYNWDELTAGNIFLKREFLELCSRANSVPTAYVTGEGFACCEYTSRMNILSFFRWSVAKKMTVVALPASICRPGYCGELAGILEAYRRRRGMFLFLNCDAYLENTGCARGETLPTYVFENSFSSFEEWKNALRSSYRRRVSLAMKKGGGLKTERIDNRRFDRTMYRLYLNVLQRSRYPLETLGIEFFRRLDSEIYLFSKDDAPAAFVQLKEADGVLCFCFGGMDYALRDSCDLYYNMLLFILKIGIERGYSSIDLGQTAENTKLRLGCRLCPKYMYAMSSNPVVNLLLKLGSPLLSYNSKFPVYNVYKNP